jgi:hypothetical protein
MSFITGKHLSRRTFLRGTGATVALPFLDAMAPAGRAFRNPAEGFTRLVSVYEAMGCAGGNDWGDSQHLFAPAKVGRDFEFGPQSQLKPLEAYRDYLTVVSQTDCKMAEPFTAEEIGGDHDRSTAVFLTQSHPLQTEADVYIGKSIDQIHADRFGQDTALPSLELSVSRIDRSCAYHYHCAYTFSLAWKSPTKPLPAILEPRVVFEQLFGAGNSAADRTARLSTNRSVLDYIAKELAGLKRQLGATDRLALDEYATHLRELERRIGLVEAQNSSGEERQMPEAPSGIPDRWEDHMELMFDLQVLALQADLTRVITLISGVDQENRTHPESGTSASWHGASHHGNVPTAVLDYNKINTYRLSQMAYFLEKMKNTMDGDKSLLDRTAIVWGSSMGDPNLHNHRRCPLILMGKANGALEGNMHLRAPKGTPMADVLVSLMQGIGHDDFAQLGDSVSEFPLTFPKGPTAAASEGAI